jgi:hypothetical protein
MSSSTDLERRRLLVAGAAAATLGAILGAASEAEADQPFMRNALNNLRNAQSNLSQATHNKSGHRANALNLVNQAIDEVSAGIAAGEGL